LTPSLPLALARGVVIFVAQWIGGDPASGLVSFVVEVARGHSGSPYT